MAARRNTDPIEDNVAAKKRIDAEISRLSDLSLHDLRSAWQREFRRPPPKKLSRILILRTLAWRLQETAYGGPDKAMLKRLAAYNDRDGKRKVFHRWKSGTILIREFQGHRHTVTVVPEGFVWRETLYPSLSAIAKVITGAHWNGPKFFGLRSSRSKGSELEGAQG